MKNTNSKAVLFGGENIKLSDGSEVFVKTLPVRSFFDLSESIGDEPALVGLFTDKTPDEVDRLPMEDFEKILEVGENLNFPAFFRWGERQKKTAEMFAAHLPQETSGAIGANM